MCKLFSGFLGVAGLSCWFPTRYRGRGCLKHWAYVPILLVDGSQSGLQMSIGLRGIGIEADNGASVAFAPDGDCYSVSPSGIGQDFVSLGPLQFKPYPETTVGFSRFEYAQDRESTEFDDDDGGGSSVWLSSVGGLGLLASGEELSAREQDGSEEVESRTSVSRRDVLAAGLGLGVGGVGLAQASSTETLRVAEFDVQKNPGGFEISLISILESVMPSDQVYYVAHEGGVIGEFQSGSGFPVRKGRTGTFSVFAEVNKRLTEALTVGIFGTSRETMSYDYALRQDASKYDPGTVVTLTAADVVVDAVREAGPDATTLTIGGVSIPHEEEEPSHPRGHYRVTDAGELVVEMGTEPPEHTSVEVRIFVDFVEELQDDVSWQTDLQ